MNGKMLRRVSGVVLIGLICFGIWSYNRNLQERSCTRELFAMDTVMSFTAYGKNCEEAVDAAVQEVQRLGAALHRERFRRDIRTEPVGERNDVGRYSGTFQERHGYL